MVNDFKEDNYLRPSPNYAKFPGFLLFFLPKLKEKVFKFYKFAKLCPKLVKSLNSQLFPIYNCNFCSYVNYDKADPNSWHPC